MQIKPGIRPNVSNADGIERTPKPIFVFIIRATVPSQPTCTFINCILLDREEEIWNGNIHHDSSARLQRYCRRHRMGCGRMGLYFARSQCGGDLG